MLEDLRLDKPFPGLKEFMDTIQLSEMDHKQFSHTPYLLLLYKALEIWSAKYGKDFPTNYKEKESLKNIIKNGKTSRIILNNSCIHYFLL